MICILFYLELCKLAFKKMEQLAILLEEEMLLEKNQYSVNRHNIEKLFNAAANNVH